jgi:hypothetical protein
MPGHFLPAPALLFLPLVLKAATLLPLPLPLHPCRRLHVPIAAWSFIPGPDVALRIVSRLPTPLVHSQLSRRHHRQVCALPVFKPRRHTPLRVFHPKARLRKHLLGHRAHDGVHSLTKSMLLWGESEGGSAHERARSSSAQTP